MIPMPLSTLGYAAGLCTTLSFVPQVVRAWRTKHTDDLAWAWMAIFAVGLTLWLAYGLILRDWPMILANAVTLALLLSLIAMKARFSTRDRLHVEMQPPTNLELKVRP